MEEGERERGREGEEGKTGEDEISIFCDLDLFTTYWQLLIYKDFFIHSVWFVCQLNWKFHLKIPNKNFDCSDGCLTLNTEEAIELCGDKKVLQC